MNNNATKQITNMKQLELFDMVAQMAVNRPDTRKPFVVGKKRANRGYVRHSAPLMEQLHPEIKKKAWRLSFSPKTTILVPCDWTLEQCLEHEKKYQGEDGKINHDPCSEQSIFGGAANRQ
ncbi:MAG: hypothetical protein QM660_10660 [Dysgonomonas sp.]